MLNLTSKTLPMSVLDDYAENVIAPRISMVSGVSQVQVQGVGEVRRARAGRSRQAARAEDRHQRDRRRRCRTGTSTCRPASCSARTRPTTSRAAGQLDERGRVPADRRLVPATACRCGSTRSPTSSTASRTSTTRRGSTRRTNGTPTSQRAITLQVHAAAGHEHDRSDRRASARCCPTFEAQLPPSVHLSRPAGSLEDHPRRRSTTSR